MKGRLALAKELSAICRYKNKVEVADIVALLSKYDLLPNGASSSRIHQRQQRENSGGVVMGHGENVSAGAGLGGSSNPTAVFLFQQACNLYNFGLYLP